MPPTFQAAGPHPALARELAREPSTLDLSAKQWQGVARDVKERAVFSAHVTNAQFLQQVRDQTARLISPRTDADGKPIGAGEFVNADDVRATLRATMRGIGFEPSDDGEPAMIPLDDARLDLIIRTERDKAFGFGRLLADTSEDALDVAPAWELVEFGAPDEPRDWPARWAVAGGEFYGGRMIALKSDMDFWNALGDGEGLPGNEGRDAIGFPPPLAYNSSADIVPVFRDECIELGLMEASEGAPEFDGGALSLADGAESGADGMDADILAALADSARGMFKFDSGKIMLSNRSVSDEPRDENGKWTGYGERIEHTHIDRAAVNRLGFTSDVSKAGYITPNGEMVDLSGGASGYRRLDHRIVGGIAGMQEYIAEGNIRIKGGDGAFEIARMPTPKQMRLINGIVRDNDGEVTIDLRNGNGPFSGSGEIGFYKNKFTSMQFDKGTPPLRVINEIKKFFGAAV